MKIKQKLLNKIFQTFDLIINNTTASFSSTVLFILIQNALVLLILSLSKYSKLNFIYDNYLSGLFNYALLIPLVSNNYNTFVEHIIIISIILYIIFSICLNYLSFFGERFCYISRINNLIFHHVLIIPLLGILTLLLFQNVQQLNAQFLVCITLIIIIIALDFLLELIMFNFRYNSQDVSCRNPKIYYYIRPILIEATMICLVLDMTQNLNFSFDLLITSLIFLNLSELYSTLVMFDYHNRNISKIKIGIILFCLSFEIWDIICYTFLTLKMISDNYYMQSIVSYFFLLMLAFKYRNYMVKILIIETIDNINNQYQFQMKMRTQYHIFIQSKDKKAKLLSSAMIKMHNKSCRNITCICKMRNQLYDPVRKQWGDDKIQEHRDLVYVKHFLKMLFEQGLNKFRESKLIEISYLYFINAAFKLYQKLYYELKSYELKFMNNGINICYQFLIYHLRNNLYTVLLNRNRTEGEFPIQNIQKFDESFKQLNQKINITVQAYYCLWKQLSQNSVDKNNVSKMCDEIVDIRIQIQNLYQQCLKYNNTSKMLMYTMYKYGYKIAFDLYIVKRVKKDIVYTQEEQNFGEYLNEVKLSSDITKKQKSCMIKVSMEQENFSKIQWISNNFKDIFFYEKSQILGKPINTLMPQIYSNHHNQLIYNWRQKGTQFVINKLTQLTAMDKQKIGFSCSLVIKILPLFDCFELIALIHKKNDRDYILIKEQNEELICSGKIFYKDILKINQSFAGLNKINLSIFAPQLINIKKFTEQNKIKTIHFLNPHHIEHYITQFQEEKRYINDHKEHNIINETSEQLVANLIKNKVNDIIIDYDAIKNIYEAKVKVERKTIKIHKQSINFISIKLIQITEIFQIPKYFKVIQQNTKLQTLQRILTIRQDRKKKSTMENVEYFMCQLLSQNKIKKPCKYNYISKSSKSTTPITHLKYKGTILKKSQVINTINKMKKVLKQLDIIGRSPFSPFFIRIKRSQQRRITKNDSLNIQLLDEMIDENYDHWNENFIGESEVLIEKEDIQVKSVVQSINQSQNGYNIKSLRKSFTSLKEHPSFKNYKIYAVIMFCLVILIKIICVVLNRELNNSMQTMISAQSNASYVFLQLECLYHGTLFAYMKYLRNETDVVNDLITTNLRLNQYVYSAVTEQSKHKDKKTIFGTSYYQYLNQKLQFNITNISQNILILENNRMFQLAFFDFFTNISPLNEQAQQKFQTLKINYPIMKKQANDISILYSHFVYQLTKASLIINIISLVIKILIYIFLIVIVYRTMNNANMWIQQTIQVFSSISLENASAFLRYYSNLKIQIKKTDSHKDLQIQIETYLSNTGLNYRSIVNSKGDISRWKLFPFIIAILIFTALQVSQLNQFMMVNNFNRYLSFNTDLLISQNKFVEARISLKQDYLKVRGRTVNLTDYYAQYYQNYAQYIKLIQQSFLLFPSQSFNDQLIKMITISLCGMQYPYIPVSNAKCQSNLINKFGLLTIIEGVTQDNYFSYKKLNSNITDFENYSATGAFENFEFSVFYILNIWKQVSKTIHFEIHSNVNENNKVQLYSNVIIIILFLGFMILCGFMYQLIIKSVNRIYGYILIMPRQIILENSCIVRFLRKFVKSTF